MGSEPVEGIEWFAQIALVPFFLIRIFFLLPALIFRICFLSSASCVCASFSECTRACLCMCMCLIVFMCMWVILRVRINIRACVCNVPWTKWFVCFVCQDRMTSLEVLHPFQFDFVFALYVSLRVYVQFRVTVSLSMRAYICVHVGVRVLSVWTT